MPRAELSEVFQPSCRALGTAGLLGNLPRRGAFDLAGHLCGVQQIAAGWVSDKHGPREAEIPNCPGWDPAAPTLHIQVLGTLSPWKSPNPRSGERAADRAGRVVGPALPLLPALCSSSSSSSSLRSKLLKNKNRWGKREGWKDLKECKFCFVVGNLSAVKSRGAHGRQGQQPGHNPWQEGL